MIMRNAAPHRSHHSARSYARAAETLRSNDPALPLRVASLCIVCLCIASTLFPVGLHSQLVSDGGRKETVIDEETDRMLTSIASAECSTLRSKPTPERVSGFEALALRAVQMHWRFEEAEKRLQRADSAFREALKGALFAIPTGIRGGGLDPGRAVMIVTTGVLGSDQSRELDQAKEAYLEAWAEDVIADEVAQRVGKCLGTGALPQKVETPPQPAPLPAPRAGEPLAPAEQPRGPGELRRNGGEWSMVCPGGPARGTLVLWGKHPTDKYSYVNLELSGGGLPPPSEVGIGGQVVWNVPQGRPPPLDTWGDVTLSQSEIVELRVPGGPTHTGTHISLIGVLQLEGPGSVMSGSGTLGVLDRFANDRRICEGTWRVY